MEQEKIYVKTTWLDDDGLPQEYLLVIDKGDCPEELLLDLEGTPILRPKNPPKH